MEGREEEMDRLQSEIERDLEIMGVTAVEDLLQDELGKLSCLFHICITSRNFGVYDECNYQNLGFNRR